MIVQDLKSFTLVLCTTYMMCFCNIHCYDIENVKALLRNKTTDYNRNLRPTFNQSAPTVIYVFMELISIQDFDEVHETLTITAFLAMFWIDEFMRWNISEYDDMSDIVLENGQFWTPSLVLTNNVNKLQKLGDSWQPVRFSHEGHARFYPGDVFSATCRTDVTHYPLDNHWCTFIFTPWAYLPHEINLYPLTDKVQITYYGENGAWQFLDSDVERTGDVDISFSIRLGRRPQFLLVSIIMPVVFMTFLNVMVFCIPAECGERMSYSITVLLAIAVFLTIVGENMPKTSTSMSIFSYYLLIILVVSACITMAAIFGLRIYHHNESEPVTGCWLKIAKLSKCRKNARNKKYKKNKNGPSAEDKSPPTSSTGLQSLSSVYDVECPSRNQLLNMSTTYNDTQDLHVHDKLKQSNTNEISINGLKTSYARFDQDRLCVADISWQDVSVVLDKYFFTLFFSTLIVVTVCLFVSINVNSEEEE